jgi:hypothetical protein
MLHMWCSYRSHLLASPCAGRKLLVPSCFWKGQYNPLFLLSQEVGGGGGVGGACHLLCPPGLKTAGYSYCRVKQGLYKIV